MSGLSREYLVDTLYFFRWHTQGLGQLIVVRSNDNCANSGWANDSRAFFQNLLYVGLIQFKLLSQPTSP